MAPRKPASARAGTWPDAAAIASWRIEPDPATVERYFATLPLPIRVVALDLDALARATIPRATIGIKWSVPHYARKGPVCYVSAAKKHVTFGLLQGLDVPDASGRLVGTGKNPIRKALFAPEEAVPRALVCTWLKEAVKLDASWGQH